MLILLVRTDKPEAEVGIFKDQQSIAYLKWHAHLELSDTIHHQVSNLLNQTNKSWHELNGVVVYRGPGSFTGLRIGITFTNTLAYSLGIPIVGSQSENWIKQGIQELLNNKDEKSVIPEYGANAHITLPRK